MKFPLRTAYSIAFLTLLLLLSACASGSTTPTAVSPDSPTSPPDDQATPGSSTSLPPTLATVLPTASPTRTPGPPAVDWREVPITPVLSPRLLTIFQEGQAQGRDPHAFSVIGDCQSIPFVFLGPFGRGEQQPDNAESYLWDALNYFEDSFDRWSVTSRGGFTAASLLTAIQADPSVCKPGETPLTCEYRLNNPAYVFITLETWLDPDTISRYESYLRGILDYIIDHGSIPILLTKADAAEVNEGTHVINPAIVRVARDYDIPVINFWRAAQYIPNAGIDPDRDGFHLSPQGYDLKNTLALRALYTIWQQVGMQSGTGGTPTANLTPTPSTQTETPPQVLAPDCTGSCIFFATANSQDGQITPSGVYAYNYTSQVLVQVLPSGYDLQDVSEDGSRLLVNHASYLYEIDLPSATSTLVTDSLFHLGQQSAYWDSSDQNILRIDQATPYLAGDVSAFTLYPSSLPGEVFFDAGLCTSKDYCQSSGVIRLDSLQTSTLLDSVSRPVFSPSANWMAYLNPAAATRDNYNHIGYLLFEDPSIGIASRRSVYFPEEGGFMIYPDVREYAFSPQNDRLFIIYDVYSAYFERSVRLITYLLDLNSGILYDYGEMEGLSASLDPRLAWSPAGDKVLFFLTSLTPGEEYQLNLYQTDLTSGEELVLFDSSLLVANEYFYITNLYWR